MAEYGLTERYLFIIIIKIFSTQDVICDSLYSILLYKVIMYLKLFCLSMDKKEVFTYEDDIPAS